MEQRIRDQRWFREDWPVWESVENIHPISDVRPHETVCEGLFA